jgi:hypothetical protein
MYSQNFMSIGVRLDKKNRSECTALMLDENVKVG